MFHSACWPLHQYGLGLRLQRAAPRHPSGGCDTVDIVAGQNSTQGTYRMAACASALISHMFRMAKSAHSRVKVSSVTSDAGQCGSQCLCSCLIQAGVTPHRHLHGIGAKWCSHYLMSIIMHANTVRTCRQNAKCRF